MNRKAAELIFADLQTRKGLKQEIEQMDEDVKEGIIRRMEQIIIDEACSEKEESAKESHRPGAGLNALENPKYVCIAPLHAGCPYRIVDNICAFAGTCWWQKEIK